MQLHDLTITHGARAPPCLLPETIAPWCRGKGHVATREEQKRHFAFEHHLSDVIVCVCYICVSWVTKIKIIFPSPLLLSSSPSFGTLTPPHSFSLMFSNSALYINTQRGKLQICQGNSRALLLTSMMGFSTPTRIKTRDSTHASKQASTELQPSSKLTFLDASVFDENNP